MKLPRAGREIASWQVATKDTLAGFMVQLVAGGPWLNATYTGGVVTLLVQGPDYPPAWVTDDGTGNLIPADCRPTIGCSDNPELVLRQGGWITLID